MDSRQKKVIAIINQTAWEKWLQRLFGAFIMSLFGQGVKAEYFNRLGAKGASVSRIFYTNGCWYISDQIEEFADSLKPYLQRHDIFDLSASLEKFLNASRQELKALAAAKGDLKDRMARAQDILAQATTYIWMAHGLEEIYCRRYCELVPKYVKGDIEKFIGDAGFPKKKNAHALFEEMIRRGATAESVVKKYGWLRCRDVNSAPYALADIKKIKSNLKHQKPHCYPKVPKPLKKLIAEIRELVWYRTARTDVFYELLFLSRPIFYQAAEKYGIKKKEIDLYPVETLIAGRPKRYGQNFTFLYADKTAVYSNRPLIRLSRSSLKTEVRGQVAYPGLIKGVAKIVREVSEIPKVKKGDILIAPMTFPNFIPAMQKAAAFVTDEGGITCHAAIVAREMKKPCVTATKIATQVFKDGDLIEVDADKGIVRKIK